ncbi:MAG: hypothetical protein RSE13_18105 [Planktothrix sp. GU0601_MAG3]|nr:MAG: hypothetical protein RSE13_18105 [Planktothrix sp. GU0601_MAG3]
MGTLLISLSKLSRLFSTLGTQGSNINWLITQVYSISNITDNSLFRPILEVVLIGVNPSKIKKTQKPKNPKTQKPKSPKAQKTINLPSLMQIAREVNG